MYNLKLAEWYELYNVSLGDVSILVSQQAGVTVQLVHCGEIGWADTNDDDGVWQSWRVDNCSFGVRHVGDGTIRYYQQHKVALHF